LQSWMAESSKSRTYRRTADALHRV